MIQLYGHGEAPSIKGGNSRDLLLERAAVALIVGEGLVELAGGGDRSQFLAQTVAINLPRSSIRQCSNCSASSM